MTFLVIKAKALRHPLQHAQVKFPNAQSESYSCNSNKCSLLFYWLWTMCYPVWHLRLSNHGLKLSKHNPLHSPVPPVSSTCTHFLVTLHRVYLCGASQAAILLWASCFLVTVIYLEIVPPSFRLCKASYEIQTLSSWIESIFSLTLIFLLNFFNWKWSYASWNNVSQTWLMFLLNKNKSSMILRIMFLWITLIFYSTYS